MRNISTCAKCGLLVIAFSLGASATHAGEIPAHKILMTYWSDNTSRYAHYPVPGSLGPQGATQKNPKLLDQLSVINVLAYAFVQVDSSGHVYFSRPAIDLSRSDAAGFCRQHPDSCPHADKASAGNFSAFAKLYNQRGTLRKIISVGGAGSQNTFENAIAHPNMFVKSASAIIAAYHLNGIDLDFEPSALFGPGEGEHYTQLVLALRNTLGNQAFISIEVPSDWETLHSIDCSSGTTCNSNLERIAGNAYVSLMGYEFHSPYYPGGVTGNSSNLYSNPDEPLLPGFYHVSDNQAIEYLAWSGVPPDRILLGFPAYFVAYGGVSSPGHSYGLYDRFDKSQTPDYDLHRRGYGSYMAAQQLLDSGFEPHYIRVNGVISAVFAFNPGTRQWISYDDAKSVAAKANYVVCRHLAGMMMWEIGEDLPVSNRNSLLVSAHSVLFEVHPK